MSFQHMQQHQRGLTSNCAWGQYMGMNDFDNSTLVGNNSVLADVGALEQLGQI
jgi:hypothetical protein